MNEKVAEYWREYYENKGEKVLNSHAHKKGRIDEDGFQKFEINVQTEKGYYIFEYFKDTK